MGLPDTAAVMENIADRLRVLLHSPAVLVFVQQEKLPQLQAVSTETPRLAVLHPLALPAEPPALGAGDRRPHHRRRRTDYGEHRRRLPSGRRFAARSPHRGAVPHHALAGCNSGLPPPPPIRSPKKTNTLASALAGSGAVAIANAELCGMARSRAHELHEILEISFELGSAGKLDEFMQTSVVRAASFLGFERCFIGLLEEAAFRIRWVVENGSARPVDIPLSDGVATCAMKNKNVFFTEDASTTPGANLEFVAAFHIRQLLAVPLIGSNGDVLGMFGVLDRVEPGPINDEDVRRARALAAQVAIALELTRNLHQSEEHRRRAEALGTLALELNTVLHLPEFMRNFARHAASLLGSRSVALSLFQTSEVDSVLIRGVSEAEASEIDDPPLLRRFSHALSVALPKYPTMSPLPPPAIFWEALWPLFWDGPIAPWCGLNGSSGELVGVLCLADRGIPPGIEDQQLLRAIAGHASVALENACSVYPHGAGESPLAGCVRCHQRFHRGP